MAPHTKVRQVFWNMPTEKLGLASRGAPCHKSIYGLMTSDLRIPAMLTCWPGGDAARARLDYGGCETRVTRGFAQAARIWVFIISLPVDW